jgi:chaperonin GroES
MEIKPTRDRVVIKVVEPDVVSKGGIIIPDAATEKPITGEVLAAGAGRLTEAGHTIPMEVKVGDRVVFVEQAGQLVKVNGEEFRVLKEEDIIAVVE